MNLTKHLTIRSMSKADIGHFGFIEYNDGFTPGIVTTDPQRHSIGYMLLDRGQTAIKANSARFVPVDTARIDFEIVDALSLARNYAPGQLLLQGDNAYVCASRGADDILVELETGELIGHIDNKGALLCTNWRVVCPNADDELTTLYSNS